MFKIFKILAAIGAVNWGLIDLFDFNLVTYLFSKFPGIVKMIYILVAISGLAMLFELCKEYNNKIF